MKKYVLLAEVLMMVLVQLLLPLTLMPAALAEMTAATVPAIDPTR